MTRVKLKEALLRLGRQRDLKRIVRNFCTSLSVRFAPKNIIWYQMQICLHIGHFGKSNVQIYYDFDMLSVVSFVFFDGLILLEFFYDDAPSPLVELKL